MSNNVLRWIGLAASVCAVLVGQSHLIGEPYLHYVMIIGLICSTTFAYFQTPPRDSNSFDRVTDSKRAELNQKEHL